MSARARPRKQAHARTRMPIAERRAQLLSLAMRAFSTRTYEEVSTEAIAESAGISHGLIFHYFPTKHALYLAVLRGAADDLLRTANLDAGGSAEERLVAGLDAYFLFVEEYPVAYATLLGAGSGSDVAVKAIIDETRGAFFANIHNALAPGARSAGDKRVQRAALRSWIGFVEALALDWITHRDLPRPQLVRLAVRTLLGALPHVEEIVRPGI